MKDFILEHKKKFILGVVTVILSPLIVNYFSYKFIEIKKMRQESKIEASKKFITDLEKIKLIAPNNATLQSCITDHKDLADDDWYEFCFSKIKQDENEARSLLERNMSSIKLFFGGKFLESIAYDLAGIDYLLYEMGNNQYVVLEWRANGCPDSVDFIPVMDLYTDKVPKDKDGKVKCSMMEQTAEQFMERENSTSSCGNDCVSAAKSSFIPKEELESSFQKVIVPGNQTRLSAHFAELNSVLYTYMLGHIENILNKLKADI